MVVDRFLIQIVRVGLIKIIPRVFMINALTVVVVQWAAVNFFQLIVRPCLAFLLAVYTFVVLFRVRVDKLAGGLKLGLFLFFRVTVNNLALIIGRFRRNDSGDDGLTVYGRRKTCVASPTQPRGTLMFDAHPPLLAASALELLYLCIPSVSEKVLDIARSLLVVVKSIGRNEGKTAALAHDMRLASHRLEKLDPRGVDILLVISGVNGDVLNEGVGFGNKLAVRRSKIEHDVRAPDGHNVLPLLLPKLGEALAVADVPNPAVQVERGQQRIRTDTTW